MSQNTKIIVLKSKELIYTGIFILLGVIFLLVMIYMFKGNDKEKIKIDSSREKSSTEDLKEETTRIEETMNTYKPGIYTASLNLGGSDLMLEITVDNSKVTNIKVNNLTEATTAMYPLISPSVDEINKQLRIVDSIDDITYSGDNKYTTIIIMDAIKTALSNAY